MSLKVELKPHERLIVGNCVITNSDQRTRLFIDGKAPVLREKDILSVATADSPAKRIYFAVQLMYLEDDVERLTREYFALVTDLVRAAPSTTSAPTSTRFRGIPSLQARRRASSALCRAAPTPTCGARARSALSKWTLTATPSAASAWVNRDLLRWR